MKSQKTIAELIDLKGKTALVTGAANGIGEAISKRLAEAGCKLILVDIDKDKLEEFSEEFSRKDYQVDSYVLDLSEKGKIDEFWKTISGDNVDILVNNAGIYPFTDFMQLDYPGLEKVMQVNLYSVIWMCQNMIRYRKGKGGVIINFGSIEAILPFKVDLTQYSLSKIGVIALTRDLAREFGGKGFRVNVILPGGIISNGTKAAAKSVLSRLQLGLISDGYNYIQRVPARRMGEADEVARVVLMLSSDFSSYIHGAMIPVDGGFLSA
jgi:NAD(P)-dependent dehydrogenase (short-subunit alcohol dehydrogenase family)